MAVADIIEQVEKLTVLELNELVKALEEKWGVSAAAPAAEKTEFDAILSEVGAEKIKVIKAVRELTNLGLTEAKAFVESAPKPVKTGVTKEEAEKIKDKREGAGKRSFASHQAARSPGFPASGSPRRGRGDLCLKAGERPDRALGLERRELRERRRLVDVVAEAAERRRVALEEADEIVDPMLVGGVVGEHLHRAARIGFFEVLEQPHQTVRIVAGRSAGICAFLVGGRFDRAGEVQRFQAPGDVEDAVYDSATSAAQEDREDRRPDLQVLVLSVEVDDVVMDRVRGLVAEDARELLLVLDEAHQGVGHVDVPSRDGERIGLSLVH